MALLTSGVRNLSDRVSWVDVSTSEGTTSKPGHQQHVVEGQADRGKRFGDAGVLHGPNLVAGVKGQLISPARSPQPPLGPGQKRAVCGTNVGRGS